VKAELPDGRRLDDQQAEVSGLLYSLRLRRLVGGSMMDELAQRPFMRRLIQIPDGHSPHREFRACGGRWPRRSVAATGGVAAADALRRSPMIRPRTDGDCAGLTSGLCPCCFAQSLYLPDYRDLLGRF
jgi:hypothetical protein